MLMHTTLRSLEEIHDAVVSSSNHDVEVLQLSAGQAACDVASYFLGGVRVLRTKFSANHRWIDSRSDHSLHLALPTRFSRSGVTINGQTYSHDSVYCITGPETVTSVSEADYDSFEVVISEQLAEDLGIPEGAASFQPVNVQALDQLHKVLHNALEQNPIGMAEKPRLAATQDQVLFAAENVIGSMPFAESASVDAARHGEKVVSHAEEILNDWDPEARMEIDILCRELGVARRTLHHAFRLNMGMGPMSFFRLKRLHAVRGALLAADSEAARVADIAHLYGFFETGRMAGYYHKHFGELPSETLMRRPCP